MELTLAVDKYSMGCVAMSLGWPVWVAELFHGLCVPFPLVFFPGFQQKMRNCNCEKGREGKLILKKLSISG